MRCHFLRAFLLSPLWAYFKAFFEVLQINYLLAPALQSPLDLIQMIFVVSGQEVEVIPQRHAPANGMEAGPLPLVRFDFLYKRKGLPAPLAEGREGFSDLIPKILAFGSPTTRVGG